MPLGDSDRDPKPTPPVLALIADAEKAARAEHIRQMAWLSQQDMEWDEQPISANHDHAFGAVA